VVAGKRKSGRALPHAAPTSSRKKTGLSQPSFVVSLPWLNIYVKEKEVRAGLIPTFMGGDWHEGIDFLRWPSGAVGAHNPKFLGLLPGGVALARGSFR